MSKDHPRWFDLPSAVLLLAAFYMAAVRLESTNWMEGLHRVEYLTLVAVIFGIALGKSAFERETAGWIGVAFSLFYLPWQMGQLIEKDVDISLRLLELGGRVWNSLALFLNAKPVYDPLPFLLAMMLLFWCASLLGAYWLARYARPWIPLVIVAVVFIVVDHYSPAAARRNLNSGFFTLFLLLLLGRLYLMHSQRAWRKKGVLIDYETGFDLNRTMALTSVAAVLVAWNLPFFIDALRPGSQAQEKIDALWQPIKNRFSNAFTGLRAPYSGTIVDYFGADMSLGSGNELAEDVIFDVAVSAREWGIKQFYWRGRSYDVYLNGKWSNSQEELATPVEPKAWPLPLPDWNGRISLDMTLRLKAPAATLLYLPILPTKLDRTVKLVGYIQPGSGMVDSMAVISRSPLRAEDSVDATIWTSNPTREQLMAAGKEYPEWVRSHYLLLPADFSPRIRSLAQEIAAEKETPYDQAVAITEYLRANITYQGRIDDPPEGSDPLEWFLFDYKKGFCNYYASSEVLMLRSLGIPARLSVGFAEGEAVDDETSARGDVAVFRVRQKDAHAWVEVFFPGLGWVEFEPTSSQPAINYPEEEKEEDDPAASGAGGPGIAPEDRMLERDRRESLDDMADIEDIELPEEPKTNPLPYILGGIAALCVIVLTWRWIRRHPEWKSMTLPEILIVLLQNRELPIPGLLRFWALRTRLTTIEKYFQELGWMAKLLGKPVLPSQTPSEQAAVLTSVLPACEEPLQVLLEEYQHAIYSPVPCSLERARNAYFQLWKETARAGLSRIIAL